MQSTCYSKAILLSMVVSITFGFSVVAEAHDAFQQPMKDRFNLKTVTCSACHPGKDKSEHNFFGSMFVKKFKGKGLTAKLEAAEAEGKEQKEAYEAVMVEEFNKALAELEEKEPTMIAIVENGLLVGTKKQPDALEELQERVNAFIEAAADMPLFEGFGSSDDAPADRGE